MELKKYVLLIESNEIMVVGVDIVELKWKEKGKFYGEMIEKSEMRVIADKWNYPLKDLLYKTSDNILDLVEVGDLVEKDNDWEILKVMRINKDGNMVCIVHTSSSIEEYEIKEYRKKFIVAIYKRQTNGDYKRYEVKE